MSGAHVDGMLYLLDWVELQKLFRYEKPLYNLLEIKSKFYTFVGTCNYPLINGKPSQRYKIDNGWIKNRLKLFYV